MNYSVGSNYFNKLSIVIACKKNTERHLAMLLSRINLAASIHSKDFEIVVVDPNSSDNTRGLCSMIAQHMPLKFICLPINIDCDASNYCFNVGFRFSVGSSVLFINNTTFPTENLFKSINFDDPLIVANTIDINQSNKYGLDKDKNLDYLNNIVGQLLDVKNFDKKIRSIKHVLAIEESASHNKYYCVKRTLFKSFNEKSLYFSVNLPNVERKDSYELEFIDLEPSLISIRNSKVQETNKEIGKLIKGGYGIIDDVVLSDIELEGWLRQNIMLSYDSFYDDFRSVVF